MNVLFIGTRAPYGTMHGHKVGMRTYIRSLTALGCNVTIAAFAIPGDDVSASDEDLDVETVYLRLPKPLTIARNILGRWPRGHSINECLCLDSSVMRQLTALCEQRDIAVVVADMIRTASLADRLGRPWLFNVDDLLSERYDAWARLHAGNENLLGYLRDTIPAVLRKPATMFFSRALAAESARLRVREVYWVERAVASSLASVEEAERLAARCSRPVFHIPTTVPIPPATAQELHVRPASAVFIGGLGYQPNLDALRHYAEQILPAFARRHVEPPMLSVVGRAPDELRALVSHPRIRFLGYVPSIPDELKKHQMFFAPIISGTGVKLKVIDAMASGLPVVGYREAVKGLGASPGQHFLVAAGPDEFVSCFLRLRDDIRFSRRLGQNARQFASAAHGHAAAVTALARAFQSARLEPFYSRHHGAAAK